MLQVFELDGGNYGKMCAVLPKYASKETTAILLCGRIMFMVYGPFSARPGMRGRISALSFCILLRGETSKIISKWREAISTGWTITWETRFPVMESPCKRKMQGDCFFRYTAVLRCFFSGFIEKPHLAESAVLRGPAGRPGQLLPLFSTRR